MHIKKGTKAIRSRSKLKVKLTSRLKRTYWNRREMERKTHVNVVADGIELLVRLLAQPIGTNLIQNLIHVPFVCSALSQTLDRTTGLIILIISALVYYYCYYLKLQRNRSNSKARNLIRLPRKWEISLSGESDRSSTAPFFLV